MPLPYSSHVPDPLEQFEQIFYFCGWSNNVFIVVSIIVFIITALMYPGSFLKSSDRIATQKDWVWIQSFFLNFVSEIVQSNLNTKTKIYIPPIYTLFLFIFFSNIVGMIPYAFTTTSTVSITFFLSFMSFIAVTRIGKKVQKSGLIKLTLPSGVPLEIAPVLVLIELVSFIARAFSLAIRLFANMMSGHSLLKILAGFTFNFATATLFGLILSIIPFSIIFAIVGLESVIAFLQAYVFTTLVTIYINDVLNLH